MGAAARQLQPADAAWFLVSTGGHGERLAKFHLERQGFETYLPMRPVKNKTAEHATAFFPRYIFVRVDLSLPRWDLIRSTIGVVDVVKVAGSLARVPEAFIARLREREVFGLVVLEDRREKPGCDHMAGDAVKVTDGQFAGFDAVFDRACSDARRVCVLLSLFGRTSRVVLDARAVRRAGH